MDLKGIAWVGNVYQKFEAMCLEVEEVIYEDTVKYVENQVQTVGASVKKFYSEVMQDVLPPPSSIDPVKFAAADLSLNPYADFSINNKPKANPKKDNKHVSENLMVKSEAKEYSTADLSSKQNEVSMASNKKSRGVIKRKSKSKNTLPSEASIDLIRISTYCEMGENNDVASDRIDTESCGDQGCDSSWVENIGAGENNGVDSLMFSYISCDPKNNESAHEDCVSHIGDGNVDFIEGNGDKSNCVFVGREDLSDASALKENKPRPCKKALSPKWLARKQEYKQLAAKHGCLGTEVADNLSFKIYNEKNSPPPRISESEWELL